MPVLAQQHRLQPHQFQQRQKHGNQRPLRARVTQQPAQATGLSSIISRRVRNWIICPTVTESSSTLSTGRLRGRSRMSRNTRTRSTVSAAISQVGGGIVR